MNGKIITVGSTKGGVGKTTLALNIAIARALAGRDVWLIDADRQGTASTALAIRGEAGKLPAIATAHYADGGQLRTQLLHQRGKFQDIVIDAGGRDSTALRAALVLSDLVLVPFQPRSIDVWAVADIAALIEEARAMRDGLQALAVLNMADTAGTDNEDAAAALADYPAISYLATPIRRRKSIANAAGNGMSVLEQTPRDDKAIAELNALLQAIY
ncbi:chromosome-partitioning ATPase Soj [Janthinobacterium sp. HH107]|jgi:chromosome partitioning protein|uniref:AAA family ATPase n=1 Tax=unclassified Janthinobacterium TaxID=2610881 RepID=UPI000627AF7E|nr:MULTISPECIES: AAA family ATPase [unclassified Janthinobacterium]KKO66201.1 Chromosome-partitioning ATPase Soj [Janthinobacterium sp. KBS0711]OEZ91112.1 chromosome-partitioning ATPase Soj [Janthinobacterium sp. HH107]TSD68607.1 AAA family ATPase [Janthinobacterium sp. KBS0711]